MLAAIPNWYSPVGHLLGTTGVGIAALVLGVTFVKSPTWLELFTIPIVFVFANFYEWGVHKYVLHRRLPPFQVIYDRHTPEHHVVYVEGDMEIRSVREFRFVLIPAMGVLGITLAAAPLAWLLAKLVSPNVGWLFLVTGSLYMVAYELTHLSYHLPSTSPLLRTKAFGALREHHARHHDPRRMQRENFNVTIPLADWVLGTIAKK